jgi:hypothetical protein
MHSKKYVEFYNSRKLRLSLDGRIHDEVYIEDTGAEKYAG